MIRVANAPVSWGVLEFEGTEGRAGYSLVLDEIRETGYAGTELGDWGFLPTDPTELRRELGQRDLALLGAFVPVALAESVRRETGLRTVFHHHCAGYVETPGELDRLLELTDPDLLGLCLDTGHYRFGGGDPVEAVRKYAGRIWHVHFKDYEPTLAARSRQPGWDYLESVRRGVFCELGRGEVDFPGVLAGLEQCGYQGWIVVEQVVLPGMGTPKESARRNREYLASIGL